MKKILLLSLLIPYVMLSQVQIGQDIDGEAEGDLSGYSVSLSSNGNIIAIGAPENDDNGNNSGHVRVYEDVSGEWVQVGQDINGEAANDYSGWSLSLSSDGSIIAIGAVYNDGDSGDTNAFFGNVRVYENVSGVWTQIGQDINGETSHDRSGHSVSLSCDGKIIAIGAPGNGSFQNFLGNVRVYENISGVWTQVGQDIDGEADGDNFGHSLSLSCDGSIVAISGPRNDDNGNRSGHVRVYENVSGVWTQLGQDIDGEGSEDGFDGYSVSLSSDGSIVAIGAPFNSGIGTSSGHVRVFENVSGVWTQIGQDIDGTAPYYEFGWSVSLSSDGSIVAIGEVYNSEINGSSGKVLIYKNISGVWTQISQSIYGEAASDYSGYSVSLSSNGSIVAIGAILNDANSTNPFNGNLGHVRVYDLSAILSSDDFVLSKFNMYPSPTKEQFTIQLQEGLLLEKVTIYNSLGQLIKTTIKNQINTSTYASGLYYVEIQTNKGKATKQLVVE